MKKGDKELKISFWLVDGFVGVLALMIYNFILYLFAINGTEGVIAQIEETMGYFCLNTFSNLGLGPETQVGLVVLVFIVAFFLGSGIASIVRKKRKYKGKAVF